MEQLAALVAGGGVVALTGAGLSTDSGIPDYRSPGAPERRPMTYADFVASEENRQRYWARSHLGWQRMGVAAPNAGHRVLADLEADGLVGGVVTQNVDRLHAAAGTRALVELHGRIDEVVCLACERVSPRDTLHARLADLNPRWTGTASAAAVAPDGDFVLEDTAGFVVAGCEVCGGPLKPHLVFFGESVPAARVGEAYALVDSARALLVLGTSLTVWSGRRFVMRARRNDVPVAIVNRGPTRADAVAAVRLDAGTSETLAALHSALHPANWGGNPRSGG